MQKTGYTSEFLKDCISHLWCATFHQRLNYTRCVVSKYQRLCVTLHQLKQLRNMHLLLALLQIGTAICQTCDIYQHQ